MATIFPTSPAPQVNDEYQGYRYDGSSWKIIGLKNLTEYQTVISGLSNTELGYLDGVTSSVQTQLNAKQATVSGVSDTEIGYLDGVTSSIQTQLGAKAPLASPTFTGTVTIPTGASISGYLTTASASSTYQPLDSDLTAIAGLTSAADRLPYFTGSGTASLATLTTYGRSLIDDVNAATARTTLGLGTMAVETASNYLTTSSASNTYAALSGAKFTGNISTRKNLTIYGAADIYGSGAIELNPSTTNLGTAPTATEATTGSSTLSVGISQIFTIETQDSPAEIAFISGSAGLSNTDLAFLETLKISDTAPFTLGDGYTGTMSLNTYVNNYLTIDTSPNAVNIFSLSYGIGPNGGNYIFQPGDTITANGAPAYVFFTDVSYYDSAVQGFINNYVGNVYIRIDGNLSQEIIKYYDYSSPSLSTIKFAEDGGTANLKVIVPWDDFVYNPFPSTTVGYEFYVLQGEGAPIKFVNSDNSDLYLYRKSSDAGSLYTNYDYNEQKIVTVSAGQEVVTTEGYQTLSNKQMSSPTFTGTIGPLTLTQSSNNASYPLTISSANQQGGGAGFSDILKIVNSKSGATNINKYFRMNSSGTLEIINSAYTASIFSVSDGGTVTSSNLGDTGWSNVGSFSNSFVSGGNTPGYRRLNNVVYLRGNINSGTAGQTAFTLPSGYRPFTDFVIPVQRFGTPDITYITVYTDGRVIPNTTSGWLTGVTFPVG